MAAKLPDQMESYLPFVKHRGATHIMFVWAALSLVLLASIWFPLLPLLGVGAVGMQVHWFLFGVAFGGFLHILADFCSISGVPIFPGGKSHGMKWYRTGGASEYVGLAALIFICAVVYCFRDPVLGASVSAWFNHMISQKNHFNGL